MKTEKAKPVKGVSVAPLTNVALAIQALDAATTRALHLPGIVVMHGESGLGKTIACTYAANSMNAYFIQVRSCWTPKYFATTLMERMGLPKKNTVPDMVSVIGEQLTNSGRALIVDEADHFVQKRAIELIRDIHEGSGAPVLLIGEENLPEKLAKWERFHNRVLDWVQAQPASLKDVDLLAAHYCRGLTISPELLAHIHEVSRAVVRRITVNLELVRKEAKLKGWKEVDLTSWGSRRLYTGQAREVG